MFSAIIDNTKYYVMNAIRLVCNVISQYNTYKIENNYVVFNTSFNEKLNEHHLEIVKKYKNIVFIGEFNQEINNLPSEIEFIYFGQSSKFNKPINNLPSNLKKLYILNNKFNYYDSIQYLPYGIKTLALGGRFTDELNNLPPTLEYLDLQLTPFNEDINNLPNGLKYLKLSTMFNKSITNLPTTLQIISLYALYPKDKKKEFENLAKNRYPNLVINYYGETDMDSNLREILGASMD